MGKEILTEIFYQSVGKFATVEFRAGNGDTVFAKGILKSFDRESGDTLIIHKYYPDVVWGFNIEFVVSYQFGPLKEDNHAPH